MAGSTSSFFLSGSGSQGKIDRIFIEKTCANTLAFAMVYSVPTTTLSRVVLLFCLALCFMLNAKGAVHNIDVQPYGFVPNNLQVGVGDTVRWINKDSNPNTITSPNNRWSKGYLYNFNDVFQVTFTSAGVYPYSCDVQGFTGTITVVNYLLINDQCAGATPMIVGTLYTANTASATSANDPTPVCGSVGKGVWYTITPENSGTIVISTCGSNYDTVLAVYTGNCGSLTALGGACSDDEGPSCSGTAASLSFSAVGGTTYSIFVGGKGGVSGTLNIRATAPPPVNDQCSAAQFMGMGIVYTENTATATSTNDPLPSCASTLGKGVWYYFIPSVTGTATISTCGSDFDTALAIYTGSCFTPAMVNGACNNDNGPVCSGTAASLTFSAIANTSYRILAGGNGGASGTLKISVTLATNTWSEPQLSFDIGVSLARPNTNLVHIVDQTNDRLLTLDTDTGTFISSVRLQGKTTPTGLMCLSLDDQFLYVPINSAQRLQVISLATLTTVDTVPLTGAPKSLAAGADGMLYAIVNDAIRKIDPITGQLSAPASKTYYQPLLKANQSGNRLYVAETGITGGGMKIDEYSVVPGGQPQYLTNHIPNKKNERDFVIAEDINTIYSTSGGVHGVEKWNMTTRSNVFFSHDEAWYGKAVATVPGSASVYGASGDYYIPRIRRFDRITGVVLDTFDIYGGGRPQAVILDRSVKVTPNGRIFYGREGRRVGLIGAPSFSTNLPATSEYVFAGADRTVVSGEMFTLSTVAPAPSGSESFTWAKISGAGQVTFGTPNSPSSTAQIFSAGSYVLEIARANGSVVSRDRVNITVTPRPTRMDQMVRMNDGTFQMQLSSEPGLSFVIEASTNLVTWTNIANVSNISGSITVTDSDTNQVQRFYRAMQNED